MLPWKWNARPITEAGLGATARLMFQMISKGKQALDESGRALLRLMVRAGNRPAAHRAA
jgi:hypothetical protein